MTDPLPSPELLRKLLRYEPETGKLFWRERTPDMFDAGKRSPGGRCARWNTMFAGKSALASPDKDGYLKGKIFDRTHKSHRVIWALHTGAWPVEHIDHIDGDPANNRIENLREATRSENKCNSGAYKNNTSGYKGVSRDKDKKKWRAQIGKNGKLRHLGYFDCPQEAHAAYCAAAKEMHGKYANKG